MGRPPVPLDWGAPREVEALLELRAHLLRELADVEARLWALALARPVVPPAPAPAGWLSIPLAAVRYGWHPDTLRRWARAGRVRAIQGGGYWRLAVADLEQLGAARER